MKIVVTRPEPKASELAMALEKNGYEVIRHPLLVISEKEEVWSNDFYQAGMWVVVSPTAADKLLNHIDTNAALPSLACVGERTAAVFEQAGLHVSITPQGESGAEALLEHPQMQNLTQQRMVVFKGEAGSDVLLDSLAARALHLDVVDLYARFPNLDGQLPDEENLCWVISSSESAAILKNAALEQEKWSRIGGQTMVVFHPRIAERLESLGVVGEIVTAENASNEAIIDCFNAMSS